MRIVVLSTDDPHQRYLLHELERRFGLVGVILERNRAQVRRLWRRRRYRAWIYRKYHAARSRWTGRSRYRRAFFLPLIPEGTGWPETTLEVDWVNGRAAREAVARWQPDVTVVCGTGIIRRSLLAYTGLTINIHGGCLPEYKGNHCIFFAFYQSRFDQIGGTLHEVTRRLDSGPIFDLSRPSIYPHDDDETLYCRSVHLAMQRLFELLEGVRAGRQPSGVPQPPGGRVFRHRDRTPWLDLVLWIRRRLGLHRVPCIPEIRTGPPDRESR